VRKTNTSTGLVKMAVHGSGDTFVVDESLVHRIHICGKNPPLHQVIIVSGKAI